MSDEEYYEEGDYDGNEGNEGEYEGEEGSGGYYDEGAGYEEYPEDSGEYQPPPYGQNPPQNEFEQFEQEVDEIEGEFHDEAEPAVDDYEQQDDDFQDYDGENQGYEYEDAPNEEIEDDGHDEISSAAQNYADDGEPSAPHPHFDFGTLVKGALDGFGGGSIGDIMGHIGNISGGGGGITNILASGAVSGIASTLIAQAAGRFLHVNPETGQLIGSIAGNILFHMGGKHNSLSDIGKLVLENIMSGKFKRKVQPFVNPRPGMPSFNLDFATERDRCIRERILFEDPEFPAADSSIYYSKRPKQQISWMRPGEILDDPQLIVSHQSRFDVVQGALGDCWLLAAAANLTLRDELFYRVVPPDQSFTENYAGIFHFQFWRYGKWVDVVIDDRLPTVNGELIYMHSDQKNEFWSALLEKAYAKLYGSYEALKGGSTAEALEDFTGGLIEYFDIKEVPKEHLLAVLVRGFQMGSLFGCSIDADPNVTEARMSNGLVRGHAYSITALQTVNGPYGQTVILRIRNPWGNDQEWNGPWSDESSEWNYVSAEQRESIKLVQRNDGEFWMSFDDFYTNFEQMENCNLGPEVMDEISQMTGVQTVAEEQPWTNFEADGAWSSRAGTAGGCRNNIDTFANNPQFNTAFSVASNTLEHDGKCTIITAVLQKYRRELRSEGLDTLPIGFVVYQIDGDYGPQKRSFFEQSKPVAKNPAFINLREVTARFRLRPGNYVIVPSTYDPDEDAEFLIRVYCNGTVRAQQVQ
uniref:Calpain catalytic domain-containing protein n=1 Tax=Panagrellus redivivus TaxID=6233 RepID=A0A7E4URJ0_PANRE